MAIDCFFDRQVDVRILEDQILVWRCKRGDKDAMCRVYEKYEGDLLTIAAHLLGDAAGAEDVLQDVFLRFVESLDTFHLTGSLKAYLSTCVVNRCRDRFRRNGRDKTVPIDIAEQTVSAEKTPAQAAICREELQRVGNALAQLPYPQREAVVLHLTGDMKFGAIAVLQEVSVKTVLSRYRYGLDKLRSLLNGEVSK
jgi:RNA polymerase sigma-70 factor (ECF subfamily)